MPNIATVVERLNQAVARDWKSMHKLIEHRVVVNADMMEHPTMIVLPQETQSGGMSFLLGMLGVINGLCREDDKSNPIEAVFDDLGELIGFKLRGDNTTPVDQREVSAAAMVNGKRYRVRDRVGNRWEGLFAGHGNPGGEQGVHIRLDDGSTALVYFHDVASVIHA